MIYISEDKAEFEYNFMVTIPKDDKVTFYGSGKDEGKFLEMSLEEYRHIINGQLKENY